MRFFLAGLVLSSCVDGSTAFYVDRGDWSSDSLSIDFNGVLWGTNAFESVQLQNTGPQEVVLELSWKEDSSRAFRVMQEFLAVPAQSTARLDVVFYSTSADLEFSAGLVVSEARTGASLMVDVSANVNGDWDGDGYLSKNLGGEDCDDSDSSISPASPEIWYDGVDQDCSGGSDYDADGDGYERLPEGADCDDEDAAVHPGRGDGSAVVDGKDNDCDGYVDEEAAYNGELLLTEVFVGRIPGPSSFLELRNAGERVVNLQGWSIVVNGVSVDLGDVDDLEPGGFLVVCRDAGWARDWVCAEDWGGDEPLGTAGGRAVVHSPTLVVDSVEWDVDWGLTELVSLERSTARETVDSSNEPSAWCESQTPMPRGGVASPGQPNGTCGLNP